MQQSSVVEEVTDAVLAASRALVGISARSLQEAGDDVTLAQYRTLVVLQSRGDQTLQDLAGELDVAPSTATRMCDRLVDKGLIRREVASDNRREVRLAVAPPGKELVSRVTRRRRAAIKRIVERMGPSNRRALVAALEDFAASAGEVPEEQWFLGWK